MCFSPDSTLLSRLRMDIRPPTEEEHAANVAAQQLFTEIHEVAPIAQQGTDMAPPLIDDRDPELIRPVRDPAVEAMVLAGAEKRRRAERKHYEPLDRGPFIYPKEGSPGPVTGPCLGSMFVKRKHHDEDRCFTVRYSGTAAAIAPARTGRCRPYKLPSDRLISNDNGRMAVLRPRVGTGHPGRRRQLFESECHHPAGNLMRKHNTQVVGYPHPFIPEGSLVTVPCPQFGPPGASPEELHPSWVSHSEKWCTNQKVPRRNIQPYINKYMEDRTGLQSPGPKFCAHLVVE